MDELVGRMEYLSGESMALCNAISMFIALHPQNEMFLELLDKLKDGALEVGASPEYLRGVQDTIENIRELGVLVRASKGLIQVTSE